MKKLFVFLSVLFFSITIFAQTPSIVQKIRLPLWAELDAYPEIVSEEDINSEVYAYPIEQLHQIAPFILGGMIYGWDFVYTPMDKARGVEEYFEITEIQPLTLQDKITYSSPWLQNNKLNCWCEFTRNEFQIQNYYLWSSIQNPTIQGLGYGSVYLGFQGIKEAAKDAVKQAVREHYRTLIKNKPQEITGSVLIKKMPTMGIDAGRYMIKLDFFLEYGRIKEYTEY